MSQSTELKLQALRIAFFGTTNFAAYHLYILRYGSLHKIVAVFTQEKQLLHQKSFWSVINIATACNLNLFLSYKILMTKIIHILKALRIDIIIVASYGLILPNKILIIPRFGCINIHGSLLPRWRGAAPIQRSIAHGDEITGISIIQMDVGIDTGNILYTKTCKISSTDNSHTLSQKLAQIGSLGLLQTIDKIILGTYHSIVQNASYATYAYKINKQEARINWTLSAIELERQIRAFNPWPVSYFYIYQQRIRVWTATIMNQQHKNNSNNKLTAFPPGMIIKTDISGIYVATGSGFLILITIQMPGKKKISVIDILNAYSNWFKPNLILQ